MKATTKQIKNLIKTQGPDAAYKALQSIANESGENIGKLYQVFLKNKFKGQ